MKKTKRLLALLLTLVSIVSLLAFPAAVAEDADCVAPHIYVGICTYCGEGTMCIVRTDKVIVNGKEVTQYTSRCNNCGATETSF